MAARWSTTPSPTFRRRAGQAGADLEPDRAAPDHGGRELQRRPARCCEWSGAPAGAALRLLVLHDDAEREFDYTAGAELVLERARAEGWTVVSVKDDWSAVFADTTG